METIYAEQTKKLFIRLQTICFTKHDIRLTMIIITLKWLIPSNMSAAWLGITSLYYGSEFGIEGRKERFSDDSLRPALNYEDYKNSVETKPCTKLIAALGKIRQKTPTLRFGDYKELELQTTHFVYARVLDGKYVITTVNNGDNDVSMNLEVGCSAEICGECFAPIKTIEKTWVKSFC